MAWLQKPLTHRIGRNAQVGLDVRLGLGLDSEFGLQDLLHGHVLVGAAARLHFVLISLLGSLALLLDGCMQKNWVHSVLLIWLSTLARIKKKK